jgi:hypothetical protein
MERISSSDCEVNNVSFLSWKQSSKHTFRWSSSVPFDGRRPCIICVCITLYDEMCACKKTFRSVAEVVFFMMHCAHRKRSFVFSFCLRLMSGKCCLSCLKAVAIDLFGWVRVCGRF